MSGNNHVAFALFTSTSIAFACYDPGLPSLAHPYLFIACSIFGAAVLDLDSENSKVSRVLPMLSKLVRLTGDHRETFLHDVLFTMIISTMLYFFLPTGIGIGFGMWTHILLDAMTVRGVSFLGRRVHVLPKALRFKSSSMTATVVNAMLISAITYGVVRYFGEQMLFNFARSLPFV